MKPEKRISNRRLEELEQDIGERDREILQSLQKCRYLTTAQIQKLHFTNSTSQSAAIRAANRGLAKLSDLGLIGALKRRIGGVRAGSRSFVWALTDAGYKVIHLRNADYLPRKRFVEPSPLFLEHTLLESEAYIQLLDICQRDGMKLISLEFEPVRWWKLAGKSKKAALRPDLLAVTQSGEYRDHWFIEIDRNTEAIMRVLEKCERYIQYYQSGAEQRQNKVFPYVLWIVPSAHRKDSLIRHISAQHARDPKIFIVITPDELERLVVGGVEAFMRPP